ncbi:uncharacterized protein MICPUCDRAFT_56804 [Micromonas pusilla CCMP1545]|uniref:Predicted protein n=1 Tax=Micromonas pusilla (strain CCMP1545) TaxID=564608 RepID=C1MN70_MICPC|nr:uncharacterized protein MICPUCDRAFT_56804 [Micromonas pusilla CCMP1545]EEH58697.1 predicted protein [Micromonas pusilla CCMP1545]|eukprot:XP_003057052.1 predicted protein [Micromonas pusilla CCMP1545]
MPTSLIAHDATTRRGGKRPRDAYDCAADARLGRILRVRVPSTAPTVPPLPLCAQNARWLRGVTTEHATETTTRFAGRRNANGNGNGGVSRASYERATGRYYVCLGEEQDFTTKEEAMAHFDATERCGLAVPYVASPLDLAAMERDGDVEYLDLDRYAHPARADAEARERGEDDAREGVVEKDRNRTAARAKTRKNRAAAAAAAGGQLRALAAACSDELGALDGVDNSAMSGGSNDGTAAYVAVERRERPSDADDADDAKKRAKTSPPAPPPPPPPPKVTDEVVALRDDVARLASVVTYMAHAMSGMRWEIDSLRRRDIDRSRVEAEDERGKEKESGSPENNAAVAAAVEDAAKSLRAILAL